MKPVTVLIAEDDAVIAAGLESNLTQSGFFVAGKFSRGEELVQHVEQLKPDVILMDINLAGELDGIQTAEQVRQRSGAAVIYITDYHDEETVQRAQQTSPAQYITKPYKIHDVRIAISMAFHRASLNRKEDEPTATDPGPLQVMRDRIFIRENDLMQRVNLDELLWIKADGSYCEVRTTQRKYILAVPMGAFHDKFDHPYLVRVHRSYVVNIDKVSAMKGNELYIVGADENETITISEKYKDDFDKLLRRI